MKSTSTKLKRALLAAGLAIALPLAGLGSAAFAQGMPDGPGGADHRGEHMMEGGMHHHMHKHGGMGGHGMPRFLRGINLTEAQRDKIFAIRYAQMPALRDKMKALHHAHEELRGMATAPQYDEAKAKAAADAGARAMADLTLMKVRSAHEIYALLTPEQRAQVEQMKSRMMEHHRMGEHGHMGERGGMGGPGGPGMAPKQ